MNINKPPYVLITGAAGGIGQALVRAFAEADYAVIATDLPERPASLSANIVYIQADLAKIVNDAAAAADFFGAIRHTLDGAPLSALVNNAAVQVLGETPELSAEAWQQTLDVNLSAPFLIIQKLLPELEAARGAVVNISSIHAALTKPRFVAYATSKAALSGMTRAMAVDLGDRIRINAIEPAAIHTEMLADGFIGNPAGLTELERYHPVGRIGSPKEVAKLALLVCDGSLPFANGMCIALDGGIRARLYDPD